MTTTCTILTIGFLGILTPSPIQFNTRQECMANDWKHLTNVNQSRVSQIYAK